MKINYHIKAALIAILGFLTVALYIYFSQQKQFDNLVREKGRYTIGVGKNIDKRKVGGSFFTYTYKVNDYIYEGEISLNPEMRVGSIYFVVFDPHNPKKRILIRYPNVPAEINLDSIPKDGWSELPVPVSKDSIRNFLD